MQDALAFENPSTSCSFLLAAHVLHRPPKNLSNSLACLQQAEVR
jgi:hypothetical protein